MSEVHLINAIANNHETLKLALTQLGQKILHDAGKGAHVTSLQIHHYIDTLRALIADTNKKTLAEEVREWVLSSDGVFLSSDVVKDLGLSSRVDKRNLSKVLERLKKENIIVRVGERRGSFRLVDPNLTPMNWQEANIDNTFNLILPLGLHRLMNLYPKNIIVIAGNTNAGKTAYLLNLVRENALHHKIDYFTNDLTEEELKKRVQRFAEAGLDTEPFNSCNFIPRVTNFLDVINPDGVTIIDYLKLTDKFWLVAQEIDKIYERLRHGVAIIAIQKDSNAKMGRGGDFAAEAARLYFTLEKNRIRIIKMKNLVDPAKDPNGKYVKFNLWAGCKFIVKRGWQDGTSKEKAA
jgi:hypothetical protein